MINNKELELEAENYENNLKCNPSVSFEEAIYTKLSDAYIAGATSKYVKKRKEKLIKERDVYKQAYEGLSCYFDSISDEEQPKVAKRLEKIFKNLDL